MPKRSGTIRDWYLSEEDSTWLYDRHPEINPDPDKYCPTCSTWGQYFWRGEQHTCDCQLQLQLHKHYMISGIGSTYQRLDWEDLVGQADLKAVLAQYRDGHQNFVSRGIGLFLSGSYGTGKTMASTLLLKDLVKLGYSCYSTTFANTIDSFTAGWKSREEQQHFQKRFIYSDVLLLDDVGREFRTRSHLSETTFDNILRTRVQDGRPTFVTTNMGLSELNEGYGSAVLSLLRESSIVHELKGEDFREQSNNRLLEEVMQGEIRPIV